MTISGAAKAFSRGRLALMEDQNEEKSWRFGKKYFTHDICICICKKLVGYVILLIKVTVSKTDWVCHVWCIVTRVGLGTMKDDSLSINTLASNNSLCHRDVFQNGVKTFSKMVNHFLPKSTKFRKFLPYNFFLQISPACRPNAYQIMYGETFRLPMSASVMVT